MLGVEWTVKCPNPSHPRGSNMKHGTTQCVNLSAIVTNALTNVIQTHRFILIEYRGEAKPPSLFLCQLGGPTIIVHIISSSLSTEGKRSHHRPFSASLEGQRCLMMLQTSAMTRIGERGQPFLTPIL